MPFDGLVMAAVSSELKNQIIGARVEKIHQPLREEIALVISKPRERYRLLLSANATQARIHLTHENKPNPSSPPMFCMVLRKHLEGGRLVAVEQPGLERILHLKFDTRDELGQPAIKTLVIEVMGKHSNIILLDDQKGTIIDGIKRYSHAVSRHREVLPGREYIAPPTQGKTDPRDIRQEQFLQLITNGHLDTKLTDLLLQIFDGFSPRMCQEVLYRTGLPTNITLNHCGEYELSLLWQHFQPFSQALRQGRFTPTAVFKPQGSPLDFAAFELTQFQQYPTLRGTMNQLLDEYYRQVDYRQQLQAKSQSLLTIISRDISRLKNKLPKYQKSLQQADRGEDYRIYGELLSANMYRLEKGMTQVEVENFYSPDLEKLVVPLDAQKTPSQNIQAYFKKYTKAKNTLEAVTEQMKQAQQELAYLESVETAIKNSNTLEDLEEIHSELVAQGYVKAVPAKGKKTTEGKEKPQPLKFTSSDGWAIWVGKNNRQNDYLTTRWAKPEDLWLHTKDIPGSHVVIRTDGRPVPPNTLAEAAMLAAYHSKAKHSNQVPVDYTFIKHVHKPNGAKPGMVIYLNQQTIYVSPDEETVQRLAAPENKGRG